MLRAETLSNIIRKIQPGLLPIQIRKCGHFQTWSEILVKDKKQNHSIIVNDLNKSAQDRLASKYIEAESLISLRLTGNHRLYGYMTGRVLNVLWYDDNHGDNNACVCRSYLKHT